MAYNLTPAPLLALRTVTQCTENEWTPGRRPKLPLEVEEEITIRNPSPWARRNVR